MPQQSYQDKEIKSKSLSFSSNLVLSVASMYSDRFKGDHQPLKEKGHLGLRVSNSTQYGGAGNWPRPKLGGM